MVKNPDHINVKKRLHIIKEIVDGKLSVDQQAALYRIKPSVIDSWLRQYWKYRDK